MARYNANSAPFITDLLVELSTMGTADTLLGLLSDGHFHSGTDLGEKLGVSRTSIWKHIKTLDTEYGLDIQTVSGKGYRLANAIELLDKERIFSGLDAAAKKILASFEIKTVLDSTNHYLMQQDVRQSECGHVVLAEMQTAGRGRRGKTWVSPFAQNIYLSLLWHFDNSAINLSGVSLAVGVAVINVLQQKGVQDLALKWPNDIYWQGRKLGGILLELKGEAAGPCSMVVGLGLNVDMSREAADDIDQAWVDLNTISQQSNSASLNKISRNNMISELLMELLPTMQRYAQHGLKPFRSQWQQNDMLKDKSVTLLLPQQQRTGIARGIDEQGALLFESEGKLEAVYAGEVSLRLQS